jgi:dTDP-4-amino-4,6-dideoxygalactose transaminase
MNPLNIQMVDLTSQYKKIKTEIDEALHRVLDSGMYILGKEVGEFEAASAKYLGTKHAIGCASGTDALQVAMMALEIGPGDEVITTPFTFVATTETIVLLGAKPVYVDIDPLTYNIDPAAIAAAITPNTKALLPVHLYGHAADMDPIMDLANKRGIPVIEDAAQAMGAEYKGRKVGGIGAMGCISFFPSKNLGAFGDAGMIVTNDDGLAAKLRMIINHGSRKRYYHETIGVNSRMDTLQAAILNVKLKHLEQWHEARITAARLYDKLFEGKPVTTPYVAPYARHIFHQYTLRLPKRDKVAESLAQKKIPHGIYYPVPLHLQQAYASVGKPLGAFPHTDRATTEVLSLPMHTELTEEQQRFIAQAVLEAVGS